MTNALVYIISATRENGRYRRRFAPIRSVWHFLWTKNMIVYQHDTLYLNGLYEYDRIRFPYPAVFQPSLSVPNTYDILVKDGQDLPLRNILQKDYANEPGSRTGANYEMSVDYVRSDDIGEYLEMVIVKDGTPIPDVEIRTYYAGTSHIVLPIYYTDADGKAVLYLSKGFYDFKITANVYEAPTPDLQGRICYPANPYKNFYRVVTNFEIYEGIKECDFIVSQTRVPVVRYLRRVNSGVGCNRQGNMLDQVRVDRFSEFIPNVFCSGISRLFDENGVLVQVSTIDAEGKVVFSVAPNMQYVLYHDMSGFDTIAELLNTSYSLKGYMQEQPAAPTPVIDPEQSDGLNIHILSEPQTGNIYTLFKYEDSINQKPADFHIQLCTLDEDDPMMELVMPIYYATHMSSNDALNDMLVSILGETAAASMMSVSSGMADEWFVYEMASMTIDPGDYQMRLRIKNDNSLWSSWGIENFSIEV